MENGIYHSAEGSTWTKKNHKYIRKEGNRYIYPEDVKKSTPPSGNARDIIGRQGVRKVEYETYQPSGRGFDRESSFTVRNTTYKDKDGRYRTTTNTNVWNDDGSNYNYKTRDRDYEYDETYKYNDEIKANKIKEAQAKNRANAGSGRSDYKKMSEQHANRKAAANGQVVNPIATWRGSNGQVIAREKTNEKISSPTTADYKKYGQLRGGASNRSRAMSNQGTTDYKQLSKQQSRKKALNSQGSSNRQQEAKDFKEYQDWEKADNKKVKASKEYYDELRSNTRNEKEFNDYLDEHNIARPGESKPTASKSKKVETWDNSKNIETFDNSKNIKTWGDVDKAIDKKSTNGQKGTFTLGEDGQTKFIPESENKPKKKSNKALEKGKAVIDSIRKGIKKKDKKK